MVLLNCRLGVWLTGIGLCLFLLAGGASSALAQQQEQPINFSHQIHAGQDGIPCQYCHLYARRSNSSGVPPVTTCIGCHGPNEQKIIRPDSPEVDKMRNYWADQAPIPWVKIHDIPDYVRFPHKKHIGADPARFIDGAGSACDLQKDPRSLECKVQKFRKGGDTRCTACHGEVQEMAVVEKVDKDFGKMGWCLQCHLKVKGVIERKRAMSTLAGWFDAKANDQKREAAAFLVNEKGYHNPKLTDCMTCHH